MAENDEKTLRLVTGSGSTEVAHPAPDLRGSRRPRVLLIDDDPFILAAYRRTLRRFFEVETAAGGEIALAMLEADHDYDVVLCDIVMPGVSGPIFSERVAARWPALDERTVFWTAGITGGEALEAFVTREAHRVFQKGDMDPRDVVEVLVEHARKARKTT